MIEENILYGLAVKLSVGLSSRPSYRRSFLTVKQPELNSGGISASAHESAERINFPDKVPFAQTANGRITRHNTDRIASMRH
ncbi:hypothetical protein RvVAT039_16610 [Agrobacterium vitis]|nr:hypothetical protein RvVAT039_16610 [Agrobacterium vitis]